ncbi:MAG: hypothetical protein DRH97_01895 [Chloroflexi bacterium]|nr:MAG: hypothetical protein DRH97_01895 [Chloroflexota bacterium]
MAKLATLFTGSTGLNNKQDPARLSYNPKTGISDLAAVSNVVVEDSKRISRRKGYTKRVTADVHSMFCDGGDCLFVKEEAGQGALCFLHSDYSSTSVRSLTPNARMRYEQVDNVIYYMNGYERGKVRKGDYTSYTWDMGTYVGPETKRVLSDPPTGTNLAYYNGQMYIVQGKTIWASDGFDISTYDLANNLLPFENNVNMIRPVVDGLYIGTEKKVLFMQGPSSVELAESSVTDYPAVEGTDCKFIGSVAVSQGVVTISPKGGTKYAIWLSQEGVCVGGPEGHILNLTEDRLVLPNALTGAGLVYEDKYVATMNP